MFCRIGISEKGQATVKLSVAMLPGHSSMPPRETSIGILAAAVKRREEHFLQIENYDSFNWPKMNSVSHHTIYLTRFYTFTTPQTKA